MQNKYTYMVCKSILHLNILLNYNRIMEEFVLVIKKLCGLVEIGHIDIS